MNVDDVSLRISLGRSRFLVGPLLPRQFVQRGELCFDQLSLIRRDPPPHEEAQRVIPSLMAKASLSVEDQLDLLRVIALFPKAVTAPDLQTFLLRGFPERDRDVCWEKVRLMGEFRVSNAFPKLLTEKIKPSAAVIVNLANGGNQNPPNKSPSGVMVVQGR